MLVDHLFPNCNYYWVGDKAIAIGLHNEAYFMFYVTALICGNYDYEALCTFPSVKQASLMNTFLKNWLEGDESPKRLFH